MRSSARIPHKTLADQDRMEDREQSGSAQAGQTKNDLDDAMDELNRSTNRLRRQFDPTDKWIETRNQMGRVMDDARRVNQIINCGKYTTQANRYWAALRDSSNDLARCYNLNPMPAG